MRPHLAPIAAIFLCVAISTTRATPTNMWSHSYGDDNEQFFSAVSVDPSGNVIICGYFHGSMTIKTTMVSSPANYDMFIAKLDPAGFPLWNRRIGAFFDDRALDLTSDAAGNVIAVGYSVPTGTTTPHLAIIKSSPTGDPVWTKYIGAATSYNEVAEFVATNAANQIIVACRYSGELNFGGGPVLAIGDKDIVLVRYNSDGSYVDSVNFGATEGTIVRGFEVDPVGQMTLFGEFDDAMDFGGGELNTAGFNDLFLAKFNAFGAHIWSHRYGGTGIDPAACLAVSESGRAVIAANLTNPVDFGGGLLPVTGSPAPAVALFTPGGAHVWSNVFAASSYGLVRGLAFAQNSDLLLSCLGNGNIDFGGGPVPSAGPYYNMYVARLFQNTGAHRWSASWDGDGNVIGAIAGLGSSFVLGGTIEGDIDLGGGVALLNQGGSDIFTARFSDVLTAAGDSPVLASLEQNVPNPFNPQTTIGYSLDSAAPIALVITDVTGAVVARLDQGMQPAGAHRVTWNGRGDSGHSVASGVYFYRLDGMPEAGARKMLLLK